jgi:acyl-coenzyme A synthetase/AMP-(fatty) acid ligase
VLAAQSARRDSAPAILAPGKESLSYAALCEEIERAGTFLAALGLGRGGRIAISLPGGPEAAVESPAPRV